MVADVLDHEDFIWLATAEPHASRRKEMLTKDYAPKLQKLMGSDWTLAYWIAGLVSIQLTVAWFMQSASLFHILIASYCISGTCNHSLSLAMHELAHNLGFGHKHCTANRLLAFFANLPLGFPVAAPFKKFHLQHHKNQGNATWDVDLPTEWEAHIFHSTLGKVLWMLLQPFFYAFRPLFVNPQPLNSHEYVNLVIQVSFNLAVCYFASWRSYVYLFGGTVLGYGIHPISGHFIAEHYMFVKGYETYSYYGPLNFLTYNVGYHNEHHDFPNVPGRLLPQVTKTAPEYYRDLPCHHSWTKVLWDFITDPEMTLFARIKRQPVEAIKKDGTQADLSSSSDSEPETSPSNARQNGGTTSRRSNNKRTPAHM